MSLPEVKALQPLIYYLLTLSQFYLSSGKCCRRLKSPISPTLTRSYNYGLNDNDENALQDEGSHDGLETLLFTHMLVQNQFNNWVLHGDVKTESEMGGVHTTWSWVSVHLHCLRGTGKGMFNVASSRLQLGGPLFTPAFWTRQPRSCSPARSLT